MDHLLAGAMFVGSLTALVGLAVRALDQKLDDVQTNRRIRRRLQALGR